MPDLWTDLVCCLNLDPAPTETAATEFEGRNQQLEYHRLFGGQLLGQFVRAAALTCPGKTVKSMHVVFAREGRADEPVRYPVLRQHEGRSFATLTVTAQQSRGVLATAAICLHTPEGGPDRQFSEPVPPLLPAHRQVRIDLIPWETRTSDDLDSTATGPPEFQLWMRTPAVDAGLAQPLAAYATDLTLIGTALRPLSGLSQRGNGTAFLSAVTSHTLWFHRPLRTDRWLLLRQHSPITAHGRSFGRGDILTEDGLLVASYAQEAMVRLPPAEPALRPAHTATPHPEEPAP